MAKYDLGSTVRKLRERKGWTQTELARRARVTQGYIAKLEGWTSGGATKTRRANPSLDVLQRVATALGVNLNELLR